MRLLLFFTFLSFCIGMSYAQTEFYHYEGQFDKDSNLVMDFYVKNDTLEGYYYFDSGVKFKIEGLFDGKKFEITKDDVAHTFFSGFISENQDLIGNWTDLKSFPKKILKLSQDYSESVKLQELVLVDKIPLIDKESSPVYDIKMNQIYPKIENDKNIENQFLKIFFGENECSSYKDCFDKANDKLIEEYTSLSDAFEEYPDVQAMSWTCHTRTRVFFNDYNYLVIEDDNYSYWGGIHGLTTWHLKSFDITTGKQVVLDDVFDKQNQELLLNMIKKKLINYYDEDWLFSIEDVFIPTNFGFDKHGITFIYNPYQIAAYVYGQIPVSFSYDEIYELLNDNFKKRLNL